MLWGWVKTHPLAMAPFQGWEGDEALSAQVTMKPCLRGTALPLASAHHQWQRGWGEALKKRDRMPLASALDQRQRERQSPERAK